MFIKMLLWILLLLPWTSLFFVNKETIKRYMPVTIFTSFLMTIIFQIAYTYKWWTINKYIVPWGYMIDVSFAYGVFAVGTFWIFYFTSQKFWLYVGSNFVMDAFFSFIVLKYGIQGLGIGTLINIKAWQYFFVTFGLSFIIYVYHHWQEGVLHSKNNSESKKLLLPSLRIIFKIKEKAK